MAKPKQGWSEHSDGNTDGSDMMMVVMTLKMAVAVVKRP